MKFSKLSYNKQTFGVFFFFLNDKTVILFAFVAYEMVIANSAIRVGWLFTISYPTRAQGIIVNY